MGKAYYTPSEITDARIEAMCRIEHQYRRDAFIARSVVILLCIIGLIALYFLKGN